MWVLFALFLSIFSAEASDEFTLRVSLSEQKIQGTELATGASGTVVANESPSLGLQWDHFFNPSFRVNLGARFQKAEVSDSATRPLEGRSQTQKKFYLGLGAQASSFLGFEMQAGQSEFLFYRVTSGNIRIEKVPVRYAQAGVALSLLKGRFANFTLRAGYRFNLTSRSHGYYGSALLEHRFRSFSIFGEAFYDRNEFPDTTIRYVATDIGLALGVKLSF